MGTALLKRDRQWYVGRLEHHGLSIELLAACCGMLPEDVQASLDGRAALPLHVRVFFSLFAGTSRDARAALMKAVRAAASITEERFWRTIPGFPRYEASTLGEIRHARRADGRPLGHVLKPHYSRTGHLKVSVYADDRRQHRMGVHRLVALAFHGEPPPGRALACHRNGWPHDNRPENLYWGNHVENMRDAAHHRREGKDHQGIIRGITA